MKSMKQEDSSSKDLRQALLSYIWNSLRNLPAAPIEKNKKPSHVDNKDDEV